jgi:DnaJ-class molecular chaperone
MNHDNSAICELTNYGWVYMCPVCGGTGRIINNYHSGSSELVTIQIVDCSNCNGTGKVIVAQADGKVIYKGSV